MPKTGTRSAAVRVKTGRPSLLAARTCQDALMKHLIAFYQMNNFQLLIITYTAKFDVEVMSCCDHSETLFEIKVGAGDSNYYRDSQCTLSLRETLEDSLTAALRLEYLSGTDRRSLGLRLSSQLSTQGKHPLVEQLLLEFTPGQVRTQNQNYFMH
ncbi:hypothetical protein Trydic_g7488 [Trypoxylus dichotomus]